MKSLLTPRWIAAHLVVVVVAVVFVNLGFWQLDRLDERTLANQIGESRLASDPVPLQVLLDAPPGDLEGLQYRRTIVTGRFEAADEVLIRSQVYRDNAGFHVITPLIQEDGTGVLVNRGWVPLVLDTVPVDEAPPPAGLVTVEAWIDLTHVRGALGPIDPPQGRLITMNRVDIPRIQDQIDYPLVPVSVVEIAPATGEIPIPTEPPTFDDPGPHLGYAIQWFGFTIVGLVGYWFLLRRSGSARPKASSRSAAEPSTTPEKQDTPGNDGGAH